MGAYKMVYVSKTITGEETQSLYDHTDLTAAYADMENRFGAAMKLDSTASVYAMVIDKDTGECLNKCYWEINKFAGDGQENINTTIRHRVFTHNDYADDNIAAYESERLAIANFHTKKASAMTKEECNQAITILIDAMGGYQDFSNWIRQTEE